MDLLIQNGTIVTAENSFQADIAVKDGKIALIGTALVLTRELRDHEFAVRLVELIRSQMARKVWALYPSP